MIPEAYEEFVFRCLRVTARHFKVSPFAILSPKRTTEIVAARRIFVQLLRPTCSYTVLARITGRTHAAMLFSCREKKGDKELTESFHRLICPIPEPLEMKAINLTTKRKCTKCGKFKVYRDESQDPPVFYCTSCHREHKVQRDKKTTKHFCWNCRRLFHERDMVFDADPYSSELHKINTKHWQCKPCYEQSAREI